MRDWTLADARPSRALEIDTLHPLRSKAFHLALNEIRFVSLFFFMYIHHYYTYIERIVKDGPAFYYLLAGAS